MIYNTTISSVHFSQNMETWRGFGINEKERSFSASALEAGCIVLPGIPIECFPPVADRRGNLKKTITTPDFYCIHPTMHQLREHVEITNGRGELPSKEAQLRVVIQAGITNYIVFTGFEVDELSGLTTPRLKLEWLCDRFCWPT